MTRINIIPVEQLADQHLLAEHREIKRIPNVIASGRFNMANKPKSYTMGKGHVKFFYDKIGYLLKRYDLLYNECLHRGFKVENYQDSFLCVDSECFKDWTPTQEEISISQQRINEKLNNPPREGFYKWTRKQ